MGEDKISIISDQVCATIQTLYHKWFWEMDRKYRQRAMGPTLPLGVWYLVGFRHPFNSGIEWIEANTLEEIGQKAQAIVGPNLPELNEQMLEDTSLVLHHPDFRKIQQFPGDPSTFDVWMDGARWRDWSIISGHQPLEQVIQETAEEIRHPFVEVVDPQRPFHKRFWKRTPWPRVWELMKEAGVEWTMGGATWVVAKDGWLTLGRGEEIAAMTIEQIHARLVEKREERRRS